MVDFIKRKQDRYLPQTIHENKAHTDLLIQYFCLTISYNTNVNLMFRCKIQNTHTHTQKCHKLTGMN